MTDLPVTTAYADIADTVHKHRDELVEFRRDLHRHPELARGENRTTAKVIERLEAAEIRVRALHPTGLLAEIGSTEPQRIIALRGDLDALPLDEQTGLPFASETMGVSHACGHDVHTTALLGAALALKRIEPALTARGLAARLIFQPAEEVIPGGAEDVVTQGGLDGVERIFAVHCDPTLDVGQVGLRVGAVTATADAVEVTLTGRGGHTSRPHLTQDLTYALAKVVTDVPAALSRRLDPRAGAALVWGTIHAGGANNVIPSVGKCGGTLRMLDIEAWKGSDRLVEELVHDVVAPYAVSAEVTMNQGVPPVVNDADCIDLFKEAVVSAGAQVAPTPQSLGGEDFAWYCQHVPGAMARLGTRSPGGITYDLHRGDLIVEEDAIVVAARTLAGCVVAALSTEPGEPLGTDRTPSAG